MNSLNGYCSMETSDCPCIIDCPIKQDPIESILAQFWQLEVYVFVTCSLWNVFSRKIFE